MLLRSPSATTTGHPLRVYAGKPVENRPFKRPVFTGVNILILKGIRNCMKAQIRQRTLTNSIAFRVSQNEAKRFVELADADGVTVSEWGRRTLLAALDCPPWARLMLGEFLALRSVVVDLQRDLMQSVIPSNERLKAILEVADKRKFAMADGRLATLRTTKEVQAK